MNPRMNLNLSEWSWTYFSELENVDRQHIDNAATFLFCFLPVHTSTSLFDFWIILLRQLDWFLEWVNLLTYLRTKSVREYRDI